MRSGFQQSKLFLLLFFTLSESSSSRKEHRPPQSMRPSSLTASMSRRRPQCSWVMTTLSNRRPYSSLEPRPTDDQARWMNSVLDKEQDAPVGSCIKINRRHICTFLMRPGGVVQWNTSSQRDINYNPHFKSPSQELSFCVDCSGTCGQKRYCSLS